MTSFWCGTANNSGVARGRKGRTTPGGNQERAAKIGVITEKLGVITAKWGNNDKNRSDIGTN